MKPWFLALLLVAAAAPAAAHTGGTHHVVPHSVKLGPGESHTFELDFEGGPFDAGWVFLLNAFVENGTTALDASLAFEGRAVATWALPADGRTHHVSGLMPFRGFYNLTIVNDGDAPAEAWFFYDQSCLCAAKPIPVEVENGLVVFNVDVREGKAWTARIPDPPAYRLDVSVARRVGEASRLDQDFEVVGRSSPAPAEGGPKVHVLELTGEATERLYFFVRAAAFIEDGLDASTQQSALASVMVTPEFTPTAEVVETPLGGVAVSLAAILLAAGVARCVRGPRRGLPPTS